jgi:hypothetical protein
MNSNSEVPQNFIDKITDKIYLGCLPGSLYTDYLQSEGVSHILSVCFVHPSVEGTLPRKIINIQDDESENILKHFKESILYIESSEKVFVHCMAGVSRSPTIVIAYLMWKNKMKFYDAYFLVANKRRHIYPNQGFREQLEKFEKLLIENDYDLEKIDF